MSTSNFDVFLSHNSDDKLAAIKLANKLKEQGLEPWLDDWQLIPGEPWLPVIDKLLRSCPACLVIVGPRGFGTVHEEEMWVALQHGIESKRAHRRFRVIPVLLPESTRGDRSRLPTFLTANTWVEFSQSIDDVAALNKLVKAIRGEAPGVGNTVSKTECPYRGLAYFDIQHAPLFFGREALTDWLLARLRGSASKDGPTRFLAIVGASGSGKSSLARAGLLAKLKCGELPGSQDWPLIICRPEHRPLESLATALASTSGVNLGLGLKGTLIQQLTQSMASSMDQLHLVAQGAMPANDPNWRLVVFVDQFEELFTLNISNPEVESNSVAKSPLSADRIAFVNNLLHAANIPGGHVVVIITMRADFYGKCASLPALATAVSQHQELVGPMSSEELRRAIEYPASIYGCEVESGLVDQLVSEVTEQPGALPLLQYALAELWKTSRELEQSKLEATAYSKLGGWKGALTERADKVFAAFKGKPEEEHCRQLFLRLVQPGQGTEDTKRLVRWDEFRRDGASAAVAWERLVKELADHRLITTSVQGDEPLTGDSTIEVVHEALIRNWPLLRSWLDADRESLLRHRKLTEEVKAWQPSVTEELPRGDESLLFTGNRLTTFDEWAVKHWSELSSPERAFIAACRDLKHEKDAGMRRDEEERRLQKERELEQASRYLRKLKWFSGLLAVALLIVLDLGFYSFFMNLKADKASANAIESQKKAEANEREAFRQLGNGLWLRAFDERDNHQTIAAGLHFLAAAKALDSAIEPARSTSSLLAAQAMRDHVFASFTHDGSVFGALFNSTETRVLTWSDDSMARLWDVDSDQLLRQLKHDGWVLGASFSRDETRVLTWSSDKTARLWDVTSAQPLRQWKHDGWVLGALFSRDETRVLTWSSDNIVRLWDVGSNQPLRQWKHGDRARGALFNRNETRVLTWSDDNTLRLWDVSSGQPLRQWKHEGSVLGALFNSDETRLLTWSNDNKACLWDVSRNQPLRQWNHGGQVNGASFNKDETRVLTWSEDSTTQLWDVTSDQALRQWKHEGAVYGALFNEVETCVLTWSEDSTARLWDVTSDQPLRQWKHKDSVLGASFDRAQTRLLTWSKDRTARLWDVASDLPLHQWDHDGILFGASFNRDETRVLTCSGDHTARLWNIAPDQPMSKWKHDGTVLGASYNSEGTLVLTWSNDGKARLWGVTSGQLLRQWKHDGTVCGAAFNQAETCALTWSEDDTARLWSVSSDQPLRKWKHDGQVNGASFNRDETRVLTWSDDTTARLWDIASDRPLHQWKHNGWVTGASFNRDETRVLTWSNDSTARLWDFASDLPLRQWKHNAPVFGASFNREATRVLTWSDDGKARLWDVDSDEPLRQWRHEGSVRGASFNPEETRVLTWSDGRTARLWDLTSDEPKRLWKHDSPVHGAMFNREATRVLTWSEDNTAYLWDVNSDQPLRQWRHDRRVYGASFNQEASRVLTWSFDKTARLWDVAFDQPLRQWDHDGYVDGASFNQEITHLLTWSSDNTVRFWDLSLDSECLLEERILEYEVRTATALDSEGRAKSLPFSEWALKRQRLSDFQQKRQPKKIEEATK